MGIGAFSLSLTVKDIKVSKAFYEALGFKSFGGVLDEKWIIMQNGDVTIGLFEGMFEKNTEGPGSFVINDPDGNPILVDQHR